MPLLGIRAPFTGPPFRIECIGKNVVLTAGRDVPLFSCETPVSRPLCWRTGSCDQSDDPSGTAHEDASCIVRLLDHPGKNPDLTWLCNEYYGASTCAQTSQGCLWLFPGASITRWHRDFDEDWQLLTGQQ